MACGVDMDPGKSLFAALEQDTDQIDHRRRTADRGMNSLFVGDIDGNRDDLTDIAQRFQNWAASGSRTAMTIRQPSSANLFTR